MDVAKQADACIASAMRSNSKITCFGAAHWDHVGKQSAGTAGPDRPGRIRVRPGGVAANVAIGLAAEGLRPDLFSIVGRDHDGENLLALLADHRIRTATTLRSDRFPTGAYIAIEDESGELVSAVADCRALDALTPGTFDTALAKHADFWFLEANLPVAVINELASMDGRPPLAANPVSPARAGRLAAVLPKLALLYCNRSEAEALLARGFASSEDAATALIETGVDRAVVTDGPSAVCDASALGVFSAAPNTSRFASATGAGDAFLARHLSAVLAGNDPQASLTTALQPDGKELL